MLSFVFFVSSTAAYNCMTLCYKEFQLFFDLLNTQLAISTVQLIATLYNTRPFLYIQYSVDVAQKNPILSVLFWQKEVTKVTFLVKEQNVCHFH